MRRHCTRVPPRKVRWQGGSGTDGWTCDCQCAADRQRRCSNVSGGSAERHDDRMNSRRRTRRSGHGEGGRNRTAIRHVDGRGDKCNPRACGRECHGTAYSRLVQRYGHGSARYAVRHHARRRRKRDRGRVSGCAKKGSARACVCMLVGLLDVACVGGVETVGSAAR